ncbi:MAG TPA: zf-HC2 domain-containing protein [Gaiellaceae bacterium]|jgi:predicted anti-sigma-YlaC factor YlaD
MHGACDRARQWATADVDGELSRFEHVLLSAHLADCPSCREFDASIRGFTGMLRAAPPETLERPIEIGRIRRRITLRLAPAVAAMAVTVVGLGSILASSDLRTRSVRDTAGPVGRASSHLASVDTMNLSTATAIANVTTSAPARIPVAGRSSLHGGPVIRKR